MHHTPGFYLLLQCQHLVSYAGVVAVGLLVFFVISFVA